MPIRIEHQPSPVAVGLAAWQTGQGAARERQQKYALNLFAQDQALRARREEQFGNRMTRGMGAFVSGLPEIPEYADPETANYLGKLRQSANILASGVHGFGPQVQGKLQGIAEEYNSRVGAIPKPSRAQQMQDETLYFDDTDKKWYDEPGPGRRAFAGGREIIDPQIVAQQQAEEERKQRREQRKADRQKAAEDAQKQQDAWWNGIVSNARKRYDAQYDDAFSGGTKQPLEWFINDEMRLDEEAKRVRPGGTGSTVTADSTGRIIPSTPSGAGPSATPPSAAPASGGAVSDEDWDAGAPVEFSDSGGFFSIEDTQNLGGGIREPAIGPTQQGRQVQYDAQGRPFRSEQTMGPDFSLGGGRGMQPPAFSPTVENPATPQQIWDAYNRPQSFAPGGTSEQAAAALERLATHGSQSQQQAMPLGPVQPTLAETRAALERQHAMGIYGAGGEAPKGLLERERFAAPPHSINPEYADTISQIRQRQGGDLNVARPYGNRDTRAVGTQYSGGMTLNIGGPEAAARLSPPPATGPRPQDSPLWGATLGMESPGDIEAQFLNGMNFSSAELEYMRQQGQAAMMERFKQREEALQKSRRPTTTRKYQGALTVEQRNAAREQRGVARGYARSARVGKAPTVSSVSNNDEFAALPLYAHYIGPDGILRVKRTQ